MKKTSMLKSFAGLALVSLLAGCGGGGGDSGSSAAVISKLQGKAIDGYLANATVCFDNGQGGCDTSLPSTTTDASGNYTLPLSGSVIGKQLNVVVTPQTTDNGKPFGSSFTLAAKIISNVQNVTPFTTLLVAQTKAGKSDSDALAAVQQLAGKPIDPNADYVASNDSATSAVAASMVAQMTNLGGQGTLSWSQVQATLNAYTVTGTIAGTQQSDVNAQLAANAALSTPVDATVALSSPLYTVDGDLFSQDFTTGVMTQNLSPVREAYTLAGNTLSITQQVQRNGSWGNVPNVGSYDAGFSSSWISLDAGVGAYAMKADGSWTNYLTASQLHPSYSLSTVGSNLVGTDPNTGNSVTVSYRTADVSGQSFASALQIDYRNPVRGAMTGSFPSGTQTYLATTTYGNDVVWLTNAGIGQSWLNGSDVYSGTIQNGSILYTLGDPNVTYTSVQQAVGTQTDISGGCVLLNILPNGVATLDKSGQQTCNYGTYPVSLPVQATWSVYPRNPNVITINLPKSVGSALMPINDRIKTVVNFGGQIVVGLQNGKLMSGYLLPASAPQTVEQFRSDAVDLIAASMRTAATALGLPQNP